MEVFSLELEVEGRQQPFCSTALNVLKYESLKYYLWRPSCPALSQSVWLLGYVCVVTWVRCSSSHKTPRTPRSEKARTDMGASGSPLKCPTPAFGFQPAHYLPSWWPAVGLGTPAAASDGVSSLKNGVCVYIYIYKCTYANTYTFTSVQIQIHIHHGSAFLNESFLEIHTPNRSFIHPWFHLMHIKRVSGTPRSPRQLFENGWGTVSVRNHRSQPSARCSRILECEQKDVGLFPVSQIQWRLRTNMC